MNSNQLKHILCNFDEVCEYSYILRQKVSISRA